MFLDFVPDFSIMATFTLACAVLFVTPGPDMSLFLAKTLTAGRNAGIAAYLGASTGSLVHTALACIGVSALLAASSTAFLALKVAGAIYLLWLAVDAVRSGSTLNVAVRSEAKAPTFLETYFLGMGVNLTNPKIVLFFVTFLPQFISADDANASGKLLFLGLYFVAFTLPPGVILILCAEKLTGYLDSRPAVLRSIDWLFAGIFCLFAVKLLFVHTR